MLQRFPALQRAKQRFLARQTQQNAEPLGFSDAERHREAVASSRTEALFEDLCSNVESDLIAIAQQVKAVSVSVRSAYQPLVTDLDQLTDVLLNADAAMTLRPLRSKPQPKHDSNKAMATRRRRPKTPDAAAKVLQVCVCRFLYESLYPQGSEQLLRARRLCQRSRVSRFWTHWRVFRAQRLRFRSTCLQARERWQRRRTRWSRARARNLLPTDGKYAMAKEFHRSKLLVRMFHDWLGHVMQPCDQLR